MKTSDAADKRPANPAQPLRRTAPASLDHDRFRRVTRLLQIVTLLQSGRGYNLAGLAAACGCCTRTMQRDLSYWRELGVPIDYETDRKSYVLAGPLPFKVLDMTVAEATAIALAEGSAIASGGLRIEDGISSAFDKIRGLVPEEVAERLDGIRSSLLTVGEARRDYSHAPLTALLDACRRGYTVSIDYNSVSTGRRTRMIEPYRVAYLNGFWMVIARDPEHNDVRKFALDRIHACAFPRPDRPFKIPQTWSLTEFTAGSVGVLRGDKAEICLRFEPEAAQYARSRLWRFPHEITEDPTDGSVQVRGTVAGLEEITWEVLRWGRYVTVLEPPELRNKVADEARLIASKYDSDQALQHETVPRY
ncbi:MAG TPA: WYL domain-containing protein [Armatimonadota bacterium]|jgi:predicted DNA-binding transcriptional regulator YafY